MSKLIVGETLKSVFLSNFFYHIPILSYKLYCLGSLSLTQLDVVKFKLYEVISRLSLARLA